jgi:hypothetical protein
MEDCVAIEGSNGMSYLPNVIQLETGEARNIVIRKCTEPFWNACINSAETGDTRVCADKTPGTGKTISTAILIRMLLKKGWTVVYLVLSQDKKKWYYEFTPSTTAVFRERGLGEDVASLNDPMTYYVVDLGDTDDNCSSPDFAKFLLVSFPDDRHCGGTNFLKEWGNVPGTFRYYPVWSFEELSEARPILNRRRGRNLDIDEVARRYREVGGVLFARDSYYLHMITAQDQKIRSLATDQVTQHVFGNADATETLVKSQPKSAVTVYGRTRVIVNLLWELGDLTCILCETQGCCRDAGE